MFRVKNQSGVFQLLKGLDSNKIKVTFVYLGQDQLAHCLFPLGKMEKSLVRAIAEQAGFDNHRKKTVLEFALSVHVDFVTSSNALSPPNLVKYKLLGQYSDWSARGVDVLHLRPTAGLGIGGVKGASEQPWYVLEKDLNRNVLVVGQGHNHPVMFHDALHATQ